MRLNIEALRARFEANQGPPGNSRRLPDGRYAFEWTESQWRLLLRSMKPRMQKRNGYWICFRDDDGMRKAAAGLCPFSAYMNWEAAYA